MHSSRGGRHWQQEICSFPVHWCKFCIGWLSEGARVHRFISLMDRDPQWGGGGGATGLSGEHSDGLLFIKTGYLVIEWDYSWNWIKGKIEYYLKYLYNILTFIFIFYYCAKYLSERIFRFWFFEVLLNTILNIDI